MDYSQTVNLPKTDFSMKAGLAQKEPETIKKWDVIGIYKKQLEKRAGAEKFILHDGPPYANGEIHMGTALNKILKDIINKYKFQRGFQTPYIPGWDCHGLPIELKVAEKLGEKAERLSPLTIRKECRLHAEKFVKIQKDAFRRLGIFGEWDNPYITMSEEYEAAILDTFGKLVEKDYIYRGLRPVHWCISCGTSLAEAEIEYHDHTSASIFVKFPVKSHTVSKLPSDKVSVLIWTTTPWTLPANTGLSFHPEEHYVAVKVQGEYLILAQKLMDGVLDIHKLKAEEVISLTRKDLEEMKVGHCWIDRESKIVFGRHVTMDTGTGIVHTAPGHGMDDYLVGKEFNLDVLSPVDDKGRFTADVEHFTGMKVTEANEKIIEFLKEKGSLYFRQDIQHSYPHCWRCKNPIIFRSKPQWFFRVSDQKLSGKAVEELSTIGWFPEWGEQRLKNMVEKRPDWCLSRQRNWGVPIPAFYCENCGDAFCNKPAIDHIIGIVKLEGIDVWYRKEASELLPAGTKCPKCSGTGFKKETDILDVWFDSGVSSFAVLDIRKDLSVPADVYLEGNDQYRGWFQASLWPSIAVRGTLPYKSLITHGWVLDEQGRQMHKSLGNSMLPSEIYNDLGADVLRLWVVTEDYRSDLRAGKNLIAKCGEAYRKIRNTFRYLLGNLNGFDPAKALAYKDMMEIDQYALSLVAALNEKVVKNNDNYEFYKSFREIYNFCAVDMSSLYLDILKDRLYIYPVDSKERLSAQTAMRIILEQVVLMLTPILPFTMEEVYKHYFAKGDEDSVHLQDWPVVPAEWKNETVNKEFTELFKMREVVLKAAEVIRTGADKEKTIGSSLEANVAIKPLNTYTDGLLRKYKDQLRYFFIVSEVNITDNLPAETAKDENAAVYAEKTTAKKCARCWTYTMKVGTFSDHPELCERCQPIVVSLS